MCSSDVKPLVQYDGTALVKGTIYRVTVLSKEGGWKSDVEKAVNKAGGHNIMLHDPKPLRDDAYALTYAFATSRISYEVTFTPDCALTEGALKRSPLTRLLRSDLSIIHDGELQKQYTVVKKHALPNQAQCGPVRLRP